MPLIKSPSKPDVSRNISEFHQGNTYARTAAKFGKKKADKQAVAVALSNARKYGAKFADGGNVSGFISGERWLRTQARGLPSAGAIHSVVPGRTDKLPISVQGGAYVLPADHVAHLGQDNSMAGSDILNRMLKMGPYGTPAGKLGGGRPTMPHMNLGAQKLPHFKAGGYPGHGHVPIIAAGGEFVIPPEKVAEIGGGDIKRGHAILDRWVLKTRKHHVKTLQKLKGPKKS